MTRRILNLLFWTLTTAALCFAAAEGGGHGDGHTNVHLWKTVNFVLLAAGLGYLIKRFGSPYFARRTKEIQQGIIDARQQREDAEARAAEMESRLARLDDEIAGMKSSAADELAAEEARLKEATEQTVARMRSNATQEISSATKHAKKQLRTYAADLALELAAKKVEAEMTPEDSGRLIESFAADLGRLPRRVK